MGFLEETGRISKKSQEEYQEEKLEKSLEEHMEHCLKKSTISGGIHGGMFKVDPDRLHWILTGEISWRINVGIPEGKSDRHSEGIFGSIIEGIREEVPVKNS